MAKLFFTLGILFLAVYVNARPSDSDSDNNDQSAANSSPFSDDPFFNKDPDFPNFPKLDIPTFKPLTEQDIKDLKPPENGSAQGYSYETSAKRVVKDGQVLQDDHKEKAVINDNGKVQEYENSN